MKRQEVLLNLTLLTLIGALVYTIVQSENQQDEMLGPLEVASVSNRNGNDDEPARSSGSETPYVREKDVYRSFGTKPLFKALITPTPTPPPPTPSPTPTPNIEEATANLKISGILAGVVYVEPKKPDPDLFPNGILEMTPGATLSVPLGKSGERKTLTLTKVDETSNPDNPAAHFSLEGTTVEKVLKMFDEMSAPQ